MKLESEDRGKKAINTTSIRKVFIEAGKDVYDLSPDQRAASLQVVGQDNLLVAAAHRKGLRGKATVDKRSVMSTEDRTAAFQAVGQDNLLVAAHCKGLGGKATAE